MQIFTLHFDGSCGPKNPGGTAAYGFAISRTGEAAPFETGHGVIGTGPAMSNNLAEFTALAEGLLAFSALLLTAPVLHVYGDSKLVINVMNGLWKPKEDKLYYPAYQRAKELLRRVRTRHNAVVTFDHVRREHNQLCDDLSKVDSKDFANLAQPEVA